MEDYFCPSCGTKSLYPYKNPSLFMCRNCLGLWIITDFFTEFPSLFEEPTPLLDQAERHNNWRFDPLPINSDKGVAL